MEISERLFLRGISERLLSDISGRVARFGTETSGKEAIFAGAGGKKARDLEASRPGLGFGF